MAEWWEDSKPAAPKATTVRSPWQRFKDSMLASAWDNSLGLGTLARVDLMLNEGMTSQQATQYIRRQKEDAERRLHSDDAAWENVGTFSAPNIGRHAVDLAGGMVGGMDPTYLIAPGRTAVQRIASQGAVNAGANLASQGINTHTGVQDDIDWWNVGFNALAGAAFQGGGELVRGVRLGRDIRDGSKHENYEPLVNTILDLEGGGTLSRPKVSPKGARGPMQVMPDTARDPGFGIRPWDGKTEADRARVGRQYAAVMNKRYGGDTAKVLAAYNWGPGNLDRALARYGDNWLQHAPSETKKYVRNGLNKMGETSRYADNESINEYDEILDDSDILAPDGLPGNGSVRPMDPEMLRRIMGDNDDLNAHLFDDVGEELEMGELIQLPERRMNSRRPRDESEYLTAAERQEMDAAAELPNIAPSRLPGFGEGEINTPANRNKPKNLLERILEDESGSVPRDPAKSELAGKIIGDLPKKGDIAPAIIHQDGRIYTGAAGSHHMGILEDYKGLENYTKESGFIDSNGKYLTRREAAKLGDIHALAGLGHHDPEVRALYEEKERINKDLEIGLLDFDEWKAENERISTEIEKFGPDPKPKKRSLKDLLKDEQGSVPRDPTNRELIEQAKKLGIDTSNIKDLNELKKLIKFHQEFRGKMGEKSKEISEKIRQLREEGKLPLEIGDRILTPKAKELGQGPWTIKGYFVDPSPKRPDRYGYRVERGTPDVDLESSVLLVSDPVADAKFKELGRDYDRQADVSAWQVMKSGGLKLVKNILDDESGEFNPWGKKRGGDIGGGNPPPEKGTIGKLIDAIRESKPLREKQEGAYSRERAKRAEAVKQVQGRTHGEAGFYAEMAALKGALPKIEFESFREKFGQNEIDELHDMIKHSATLSTYEKINARQGLAKILGENGSTVPSLSEIKLMSKIFPDELIAQLLAKRPLGERFWRAAGNLLNIPRSIMSSFDLSAPLRQGAFMIGRKEFWKNWGTMFRALGSERTFQSINNEIASRPNFKLMKKAGLALADTGKFLEDREEAFMSSWAEKIPIVGSVGIKRTNAAYVAFLNRLRADTFDSLVKQYKEAGINLKDNPKALKDIAKFINAGTGRGDLGKLNQAAPVLSGLFFSPRLMASRVQLMNPVFYVKLDPIVRKEALKSLFAFSGISLTVLGLAATAFGDDVTVEHDPRSPDFGKIRHGNTRYDTLAGFQQYIRTGAQVISGQKMDADTREIEYLGEKYGGDTRFDAALKFFTNKTSPIASFVIDMLKGRNAVGEKFDFTDETVKRFVPMITQDIQELYEENGSKGLLSIVPGMFGVGVQAYGKNAVDEPFSLESPPRTVKVDGEEVRLDDEQYSKYTELSTQYYKEAIEEEKAFNSDWDFMTEEEQKKVVNKTLRAARKQAREEILDPWEAGDDSDSEDWWAD